MGEFRAESPREPALVELRDGERLAAVIAGPADEWDAMLRLARWPGVRRAAVEDDAVVAGLLDEGGAGAAADPGDPLATPGSERQPAPGPGP